MTAAKKINLSRENALETLQFLAKEIWTAEQDFTTPFMGNIGMRMSVIRLPNAELLIHAPVHLTEHIRRDLIKLGTPRYLIGCQSTDPSYFGQYQDAFPSLKMYGTPGLLRKLTDITFYGTLSHEAFPTVGQPRPWADQVDQYFISGKGDFEEVLLFHKSSQTVVVADLFCNLTAGESWIQSKARQVFAGENALRISRPTRRALRKSANRQNAAVWLDSCSPLRIVMNHGEIFEGSPEPALGLLTQI